MTPGKNPAIYTQNMPIGYSVARAHALTFGKAKEELSGSPISMF
jgi:hypothetical protein